MFSKEEIVVGVYLKFNCSDNISIVCYMCYGLFF